MGGKYEAAPAQDAAEIKTIQTAIELGVTHIDTAELYAGGHSEELLGSAIAGYPRGKLLIGTKVAAQHLGYDDVFRAVEGSLKRLGTDYIDLCMMHRYPGPDTPIADTMRAFNELLRQGVIKNIGACNFTVKRLVEAQKHTSHPIVCNQLHYNVQFREPEAAGLLEFSQQNDMFLVAWRPLQKGVLLGSALLDKLAEKYGKTPAQVAINWLVSQANVVTISRTSNIEHLQQNLGALGWAMEPADIEQIRQEFPNQQVTSDAVPLDYPGNTPA